jgi:hypothetical protein
MFEVKAGPSPSPYNFYTGAFIANLGTSSEVDIMLKSTTTFTPTSGSTITIHADSITYANTFHPTDSIDEIISTSKYNLPVINTTGKIDVNYSLSYAATDQQPGNNSLSYSAIITDSVYSKGRLNETTGEPIVTTGYKLSSSSNQVWGPFYYVKEGGHKAYSSQFTVSNGTAGSSLSGSIVNIYAYSWNDVNNDSLIQVGELNLEGAAAKQFTIADSNFKTFSADYQNLTAPNLPVILKANTWYWIAAEVAGTLYLGCDADINYYCRSYLSSKMSPYVHEFWAPQYSGDISSAASTDNLIHFPFTSQTYTIIDSARFLNSKGLVPAVNLHVSKLPLVNSVEEVPVNNGLYLFPNPTNNELNIKYQPTSGKNVIIRVIDALGRIVYLQTYNISSGTVKINTHQFMDGNYYLVLQEEDGKMVANKFIISK